MAGRRPCFAKATQGRQKTERLRRGSAIILAVVLTSLLAIIGVMFLLSSRVDSIATSAISENKDLNLAVDTVIAQISEELSLDVPGVEPNGEYYDYPDANNAWLACLEPYQSGSNYFWRQISNVYDFSGFPSQNVIARILPDYNDTPSFGIGTAADADGDGVSDSMWVKIPNKTSAKGKPIFAAIRIIDNSGMLNVNTGFKFDPNNADGSSQTQINLMALSWRSLDPNSTYNPAEEGYLFQARAPANPSLGDYESYVVWQYGEPCGPYTPFDISDELEMRNRFILNHSGIDTRLEDWGGEWRSNILSTPVDSGGTQLKNWLHRAGGFGDPDPAIPPDPCYPYAYYTYRHIATTYNLDRIIDPAGQKMFNINSAYSANKYEVRDRIEQAFLAAGLDPVIYDPNQMAVNLIDYIDADDDVTVIDVNKMGMPVYYFGFETPCIYISELAQRFIHFDANTLDAKSYAIELYKPYWEDRFPSTDPNYAWRLFIVDTNTAIPIVWSGSPRFHVIEWVDYNAPIEVNWSDVNGPNDVNEPNNPRTIQYSYISFSGGELIELQRRIPATSEFLTVDYVWVPGPNDSVGWLKVFDVNDINEKVHSYQRDIGGLSTNPNKLVRGRPIAIGAGLWSLDFGDIPLPSIGGPNPWVSPEEAPNPPYTNPNFIIQAHPENRPFTNVGEIGKLFRKEAYRQVTRVDSDFTVKLDLAEPVLQRLFDYLTVIDPFEHGYIDPNNPETRIKGRININTAPWFVIAQLPWVSQRTNQATDYLLARSIVAYRDRTAIPGAVDYSTHSGLPGFRTIGELMDVNQIAPTDPNSSIFAYAIDGIDQPGYPDLTTDPCLLGDGATDDFEERDVIFSRISNLVTVRSDVFTAYILVRIGVDGPQKRIVAILDRSQVTPAGGNVKVIAIQSVPDPR